MTKKNTTIIFPDATPIIINEIQGSIKQESFKREDLIVSTGKKQIQSKISIIINDYIIFLTENKLLPDLPNELKIKYVKDSSFFSLDSNKKRINNVSANVFENYSYPACMSPSNNTLYLSNDLELDSNIFSNVWNKTLKSFDISKSNAVLNYREIFNHDNQKVLDYLVGHELGHFFLQIKNKDKKKLNKDLIFQTFALNIEEAFSESFSLHIMCLRNNNIEEQNIHFEKIKQYRIDTEKYRLRFFKNSPTEKDSIQYQQYFKTNGVDKLINTYDFPIIYEHLPFKCSTGHLEKDIDKIYKKCHQLALDNNREVIKNLVNNSIFQKYGLDKIFINEIEKSLNVMNKEKPIDELVSLMHKQIEGMSFSTQTVLGLREKYFSNNIKYKQENKI